MMQTVSVLSPNWWLVSFSLVVVTLTGKNDVTVLEDKGPVHVCVKFSGTATNSTDVPITLMFTPKSKPYASDPAEGTLITA